MKKGFLVLIMTLIIFAGVGSQAYADINIKGEILYELSLYDKIRKTQDEINEKYNNYNNNQENMAYSSSDNKEYEDGEISVAYQAIQDEENYIVNLINKIDTRANTTLSNWEYNLKWLKENYDMLKEYENEKINFKYVDSYIEAYEFVLLDKNTPDEKEFNINSASYTTYSNSYSAYDAVKYAEKHYEYYNDSNYPDWTSYGGDCANFVSQCLYAGGKSKRYGNDDATDFSNWFSDGNDTDTDRVSSTWRGADAFKHYWKSNADRYKKFTSFDGAFRYGWKGDSVSLLNNNDRAFHTLIIVGYDSGDLVYGSHTADKIDGSLRDASNYNNFIIYNMD